MTCRTLQRSQLNFTTKNKTFYYVTDDYYTGALLLFPAELVCVQKLRWELLVHFARFYFQANIYLSVL